MAHHKRRRPKNRRSGCLLCKPWKVNGYNRKGQPDGERFGDHRRRYFAQLDEAREGSDGSVPRGAARD